MGKRIILPGKFLGMHVKEHCLNRMRARDISLDDIEKVITNPDRVIPYKRVNRKRYQAMTERGFITIITDLKQKNLYTCWVN